METTMKKLFFLSLLIIPVFALSGCAGQYKERKAPCPPSASMSTNPCNHIPINLAMIEQETKNS